MNSSARRPPHAFSIDFGRLIRPGRYVRRGRDWEIWTLRRPVLLYVLAVQLVAIASTAALLRGHQIGWNDLVMMVGISVLGIVKEELTRHVEQMRRRYSDTPHQNMTSVWTFAAALVLPAGLAAVVVATLYAHLWFRTWHPVHSVRAWKVVFSASAVTLSCHAATGIRQLIDWQELAASTSWRTVTLFVIAILLYSVVNLGLVAGAIALMSTDRSARRLLGMSSDISLEYATLAMGALAAVLLPRSPGMVIFLFPVLLMLHRNVLIRQLEEAASTDAKTGLLTANAWRVLATTEFDHAVRDGTEAGVLMLDLDHFKRINDTHGHPAGDQVLAAVATRLASEMREYDLLGRFGGEEFVVFCPDMSADALTRFADRLRGAVEELAVPITASDHATTTVHLTISIGAAHHPESGTGLDEVLLAADNALFAAKDSGRNRVEVVLRPRQPTGQGPSSNSSS